MIAKIVLWYFRWLDSRSPKGPKQGTIFYETDTGTFKRYNGKRWVDQDEDYATKARLYYGDDQY